MNITLSTLADIYSLDVAELTTFIESKSIDYGIRNGSIDTRNAGYLMADFCDQPTRNCDVCKRTVGRSLKNPNLANGFRDAALGIFVCWPCSEDTPYEKMKLNHDSVNNPTN
jgi:hypothetical protein